MIIAPIMSDERVAVTPFYQPSNLYCFTTRNKVQWHHSVIGKISYTTSSSLGEAHKQRTGRRANSKYNYIHPIKHV